jgi:hypothetical protein
LFTGVVALALAIAVTRCGLTHAARAPSDLADSFLRGVNAVIIALLHPLWRTHTVPAPGSADRWIIAAALVLGYRQLEASRPGFLGGCDFWETSTRRNRPRPH